MKHLIDRLHTALVGLTPRERVMVLTGGAVVAVTLGYLLVWEPLAVAHHTRAQALQQERLLAERIERAAAQVRASSSRAADRRISLLTAVDQTSRTPVLGKPPARIQPEGDREVKVWIDEVPFANLLRWIQELQTRYGITTRSAEIERGSAPGVVNARLTLVRE
ncbi:general secretion pathway protein M [Fontimonas thermophila]|uniref:Type II secretion system protein M n=1 Tax=Fontimonas thermophila TaxID=1076937 RepID=A0A1I2HUJ7_9GAMM|nr:type II secretion system protein M [Fontimonas thermophila]SFF32406.1 general secretion pathway protein M [Fontimonas thermophila]